MQRNTYSDMQSNTKKLAALLAAVLIAAVTFAGAARAEDAVRIAAIVNDDVISGHDLEQRIRLVLSSTGQPDTPTTRQRVHDQILSGLIDERIELQEAKRLGIKVTDEDMDRAFEVLEKQNNVPKGRFEEFLHAQGVDKDALAAQLRPEIAWSKVIRQQLLPNVDVTDDDVNTTLARLKANSSLPESLVSQIFLPVDAPDKEETVNRDAERLVGEIRGGANFAAMARQYSRDQAAQAGGELGWVQPGSLAEEIEAALSRMQPGQISDPIRALGGFYIEQLRDRRAATGNDPDNAVVTIRQIVFNLPKDAPKQAFESASSLAQSISDSIEGCDSVPSVMKELGARDPGEPVKLRLVQLPPALRPIIEALPIGKPSQPLRNESSIAVFVVCDKTESKRELPTADQVRQGLTNRRMDQLSRRYLRDLRRDAIIEIR
ncbi:MAG TPA: peptidylprolyl isomerase [Candidatus Cybelea sp.]|nr:peptidylprolyl isomerase [Candidatus Cybelea sp.]